MANSNFRRQAHILRWLNSPVQIYDFSVDFFIISTFFFNAKSNVASVYGVQVTLVVLTGENLEELAHVV